jgi:RNA polymerase sigma factor (sigma-70 family)
MSDSFGVHAPEDRERLESCLEILESTWQCGDEVRLAQLLLDADLSHEILRRLHRELLWISSRMADCQDSDQLEKELGCLPWVFRQKMRTIAAAFDRMTRRRNELVESHLGLVLAQASQFERLGVPVADLVQEGNAGLLRAAERFDPSREVAFVTYALWWIRHGMIRAVQNHGRTVRLPTHRHEAVREFRKRERELERELGRPPRRGELARALGVEASKVDELQRVQAPVVSLDAHLPDGNAGTVGTWVDVLGDPKADTAIETVENTDQLGQVLEEIATLPPRERRILMLR